MELDGSWDPISFVLLVIMQLNDLEVADSSQLRLLRMLFRPLALQGLAERHIDFVERQAARLSPPVLSELLALEPRLIRDRRRLAEIDTRRDMRW